MIEHQDAAVRLRKRAFQEARFCEIVGIPLDATHQARALRAEVEAARAKLNYWHDAVQLQAATHQAATVEPQIEANFVAEYREAVAALHDYQTAI